MNKLWIAVAIFVVITGGGLFYMNFINQKTSDMIELADKAYSAFESGEKCDGYLDEIDEKLEKISGILCAFLDRDIINEAKDAIVYSKGLAKAKDDECGTGILMVKEKISHIKNTAQIKLKYIL